MSAVCSQYFSEGLMAAILLPGFNVCCLKPVFSWKASWQPFFCQASMSPSLAIYSARLHGHYSFARLHCRPSPASILLKGFMAAIHLPGFNAGLLQPVFSWKASLPPFIYQASSWIHGCQFFCQASMSAVCSQYFSEVLMAAILLPGFNIGFLNPGFYWQILWLPIIFLGFNDGLLQPFCFLASFTVTIFLPGFNVDLLQPVLIWKALCPPFICQAPMFAFFIQDSTNWLHGCQFFF